MPSTSDSPREQSPAFAPADPDRTRAERVYASLFRIAERHAASDEQRQRQVHPSIIGAHEAIRLVSFLLSGAAQREEGEPEVDHTDITAALTLIPLARGEMDELEAGLLQMARGRGMTWPEIAFGLGLGTPQAARQRYERLLARTGSEAEHQAPAPTRKSPATAPATTPTPAPPAEP
ncbi:DNA-binding protein [Streptomyces sp. 71268]|uniref:DNA-binding protein n=1 Tax=Streptomyces sp. 71268 TaxID=3002640 RepID=UPI0023F70A30|nr:DNA-binding protein [Streptomyces sp. 71268]WEV26570.1 DNA-binding protein [Streptomyces sp. 71268]